MTSHVEVRPGAYADSVALLQVSRDLQQLPGVDAAQVAMATALNLEVLQGMGFTIPEDVTANDLVVAVRLADGATDDALDTVLAAVASGLTAKTSSGTTEIAPPRTTGSALRRSPDALTLVTVPGPNAAVEAADALDAGRDVMIFSDNVTLEEEIALKRRAADRGALVMGPDCGTAVVGGLGLGFANVCRPGPVGIVAASGTGCQQLMCLLDQVGVGVTHALGVGGRDLSAAVGGLSTREALRRLDADPTVELIVMVSKPPASEVASAIEEYAATLGTRVVFAFLGAGRPDLADAARLVLATLGQPTPDSFGSAGRARPKTSGAALRGLFVGGTLCDEAMLIAAESLGPIRSNIPLEPALALGRELTAPGHLMIDFGDDALTVGRAHPMIDPTLRLEHLARLAADPETGVLLLDVVLGHGAEPDPAAHLAPVIAQITKPVIVTVVGTDADPQVRHRQFEVLTEAGAEVYPANAEATRRAIALLGGSA